MHAIESAAKDLRYGLRQLRQSPSFTIIAVLSLALGVGANTAMFQLIDAVRLRTLPVSHPEQLVSIDFPPESTRAGWFSTRSARFTFAHWQQIRERQQAFTGVLAWSAARFNLSPGGEVRNAEGLYVSGGFFQHLGVTPALGRTFNEQDDTASCDNPGVVLSHAFWQREFAGSSDVLGRKLSLDGQSFPVIGVTQPTFFGVEVGNRYDVAVPLCADRVIAADSKGRIPLRHAWWLSLMGRLKPGWSAERATAHLAVLSPEIMKATLPEMYRPDMAEKYLKNKIVATEGSTGVSGLRRQFERPLWLLMAITGLVLLIACANLANLLLARASVREREMAVRLAIGASRSRVIRQLLAESLLLAVIGSLLGALLAQVLSNGLVAFLNTPNRPLFVGLHIDLRVLGFTSALAVGTCLLFGLLPAFRATELTPAAAIRGGGRSLTAGREGFSLRRILVATQVALSLVLLVGALLFARSLGNLMSVDPGFQPEGVITVSLDYRRPQYSKERRPVVNRELLQKLSSGRGVVSVAQVLLTPVSGSGWDSPVRPDGPGTSESGKDSFFNRIGPGYFHTMGTALVDGREFDDRDSLSSPKVAIVNQTFARKFFSGANPVGRTFHVIAEAGKPDPMYQIVGLVKNTKYYELKEDFVPIAFFPMAQDDDPGASATFVLRTRGSVGGAMREVKSAVAEVSPAIDIQFRSFSTQLQESLLREKLMATLSGGFGLLAALLATLGLYGVIAYMVARRRNEIGLRIALGADSSRVIRMVLGEAGVMLGVGLVIGAVLAVWAGQAATTLLYGLQPHDPVTMVAAMGLLSVVALAASYGPARRAAGVEPMAALREE
jgi:putative ABC transport system permease protein